MNYDTVVKKAIVGKELMRAENIIYRIIGSGDLSDKTCSLLRIYIKEIEGDREKIDEIIRKAVF